MKQTVVFKEDFKGFSVADFPYEQLHGAMGEYHFRPPETYAGAWYDPIPTSTRSKTWIIAQVGDRKCMEYAALPLQGEDKLCLLATGEPDWTDYTVEMKVRNLLRDNTAGMIFRYANSRCYYMLALTGNAIRLLRREHTEITCLAEAPHPHTQDRFFTLRAECRGDTIVCLRDGEMLFTVRDTLYPAGRIAFGALAPAQFTDIVVTTDQATEDQWARQRSALALEVAKKAEGQPRPKLWKTIDFKNFGCGRSLRFGHLLGNGELQIVLAQNQQRIFGDAFAHISCLTAVDLDGNVLWQVGEPSEAHMHLTADVPLQVYDIDGDGYDEVIYAHDFKIIVLDGRTGMQKKWAHTPVVTETPEFLNISKISRYPYDRLNVDAIRIVNLSGKERPSDLLIKDRYKRIWALNSDLEVLWTYAAPVNPGHFPYAKDVNGDGRDEVFVGYDLLSADGELLWSLPIHTDHTDEIIIGKTDPDRGELILMASGYEGFNISDLEGNLIARRQTGHAQRISCGNYRPDLPGLETAMVTYWGNQGILFLYDCKGRELWSCEPSTNGNILTPVNWTGDGQDLILLSGNCERGGMIDGWGHQVVRFPDDGHPELCCEAFDIAGDARDEVILWDTQKMYIYTQDRSFAGDRIAKPEKYPHYNASNYRGEYAFPNFVPYEPEEG
ncbi:MAG TPA: hypothetical protein PKE04_02825 [Clostridia bacterium]|nr:hypothetical protein [Clostridia bacterium]